MSDSPRTHVLFVCSRNQWRSPTAERVWRSDPRLSVRSAGTSASARRRVTSRDIAWAHVIFAMEDAHRRRLEEEFGEELADKVIHVLDIPDEYVAMAPELVEELERSVAELLGFRR